MTVLQPRSSNATGRRAPPQTRPAARWFGPPRPRPPSCLPALLLVGLLPFTPSCAAAQGASDAGDRAGADTLALLTEDRTSGTDVLLQAISAVPEDVVWVAGHGGTWLRSLDGGETWRGGVVPGADRAAVTDDAGRSWRPVAELAFPGPAYGSALTEPGGPAGAPANRTGVPVVVAVGPGGVAWSSDGGGRWILADERRHWAVAFAGPGAGWAVGPGGRITALQLVRR